MLLKGYFIDGKPKQDNLLIARLHRDQCIPIPLIAMITVLVCLSFTVVFIYCAHCCSQIGHALQEFSSGFRVQNSLSNSNVGSQWAVLLSKVYLGLIDQQFSICSIYTLNVTRESTCLHGQSADWSLLGNDVSFSPSEFCTPLTLSSELSALKLFRLKSMIMKLWTLV